MNSIFGLHSVEALLKNKPEQIEIVYIDSHRQDKRVVQLVELLDQASIKYEYISKNILDKKAPGVNHQGIVAMVANNSSLLPQISFKDFLKEKSASESSIVIVLDGITDPHNLGAIIRTCDCFGVDAVIVPKDNSASVNATVAKTSAGAVNYVPVIVVNNLARTLEELKEHNYWIAGTTLAENSVELFDFTPDKKIVWVMGSEDKGIRRLVAENCDYLVSIPMEGNTQSLNVSVAAGVVLSYTKYVKKKN